MQRSWGGIWLAFAVAAGVLPAACGGSPVVERQRALQTVFQLVARHSGKCVSASGAPGSSSAATQVTCAPLPTQQWSVVPAAGGVRIVSAGDPSMCLNIAGASQNQLSPVVLSSCSASGVPGEIWSEQASGNYVNLVATHSGQCMDVYGVSTADGAAVIQWPCNGQQNQLWALQAVSPPVDAGTDAGPAPDASGSDGGPPGSTTVQLVADHSGKCLAASGVPGQTTPATQQTCGAGPEQRWSVVTAAGGVRFVSSTNPTMCLNVAGASQNPLSPVVLSACSASGLPGEVWSQRASGGFYNLVATASGQCMDVYGVSTADGAAIIQYTCNGQTNQLWSLRPVAITGAPDGGSSADARDAGAGPPADAGAGDAGIPAANVVRLVAQHSAKCLTAAGGPGQSTPATQESCGAGSDQRWSMVPASGGVRFLSTTNPAMCLNIASASQSPLSPVVLSACSASGVPGEIWSERSSGGFFNLVATHSQQCLDVYGVSTSDGAAVIQYTCNGQSNQLWAVEPAAPPPPADAGVDAQPPTDAGGADAQPAPDAGGGGGLPSGPINLVAQHSGKCLQGAPIQGPSTPALQETCWDFDDRIWSLRSVSGGVQIRAVIDPSQCLLVPGGSQMPATPLALAPCSASGAAGEVWIPTPNGRSTYNLVSATSQQCADVSNISTLDGAAVMQWPCNGGLNQLWALATPPDRAVVGQWSAIISLPSTPVAAAVLPNGKIITWASWQPYQFGGTSQLNQTYTALFDPQTLTATNVLVTSTSHDMFCPGTAMLPDGRVFVNGGGPIVASTSIYDAMTANWSGDAVMTQPRWYNVSVTLPNGRVFTLGGNLASGMDGRGEIWAPGAGWTAVPGAIMDPLLTGVDVNRAQEHPRLFVAPNGKIFAPGATPNMQWYDLTGSGSVRAAGPRGDDGDSQNDATVMFDVGKLLKAGGNPNYGRAGADRSPSSPNAYVIDITTDNAVVQKIVPLHHARAYATGVVLPDGEVLIAGGLDNGAVFSDVGAVHVPEMFDPTSETFRELAPENVPRAYHSVALLMPDGRVFVGGGGLCGGDCVNNHADAEIYSPPYLFAGSRPQITAAPAAASYGSTMSVTAAGVVTRFSLVRLSSTTHTVNTDQRYLAAAATSLGAGSFAVRAPANANIAPPGYYMLFALAGNVPSVAKLVRLGP